MVLTFESVDEILWCDHSNQTSYAVLSQGAIYFLLSILKSKFWKFCRILSHCRRNFSAPSYLVTAIGYESAAPVSERPGGSNPFHGFMRNQLNDHLSVALLDQLVIRALHRYHRGQGFESLSTLNFF